jgi:hypothetical protein
LAEFPHGLDKHVLAEFLRFGVIAQPAEDRGIDRLFVTFDQAAERLPIASLRGANRIGRRNFIDRSKAERFAKNIFVIRGIKRFDSHDCYFRVEDGSRWPKHRKWRKRAKREMKAEKRLQPSVEPGRGQVVRWIFGVNPREPL